jgi:glycosyltransferase involved in cell wall biosynthesis
MTDRALPPVSIVLTNYNQAGFIGQAVAGALAQDYPNLEVILSDDYSTEDPTPAVAPFMSDPRFRFIRNERNLKRVGNYRRALYEYMTGEWAMVVDGDDYVFDPGFVSRSMAEVARRGDVVLVFGGCRMLTPDGRYKDHCETAREWQLEDGREYFLRWGIWLGPPHQASIYRRDLAMRLDFYRYDILSADWEALRRLVLHGRVLRHGRPVSVWRRHEVGASNTMDARQRIEDLKSITEPYREAQRVGVDRVRLDAWRRRTLSDYVVNNVHASVLAGRPDCARDLLSYMQVSEPEAYRDIARRLALSPKLGARWALLKVGGRRLANWPSDAWRQLTWRKQNEG